MMTASEGGIGHALANAVDPWAKLYAHSKVVSATVLFLHLAPLVFGAGAAFLMDRATLRASRGGPEQRAAHLVELSGIHRAVLAGLTLSLVSGVLMFLSDVETFLGAILFWIKITLVTLLLVNGYVMLRTEEALSVRQNDDALWGRLRLVAMFSAVLWLTTTLAGVVLKEFS